MRDYTNLSVETAECAQRFGASFALDADELLFEPLALVEATVRWHIRGDADVEALSWLSELVAWQERDSDMIARAAAVVLEKELLPIVDAFCSSSALPTLPA